MRDRRKLSFDRADSKARYKRLNRILNHPEEAESEELKRAVKYAEHMTGQMDSALQVMDDVIEELDDPNSDIRLAVAERDRQLDLLNKAITRVEEGLVEKYQGRCAAVELDIEDGEYALMFWVRKGRWGLYVMNAHGSMQDKLVNCRRDIRLVAVPALEDLILGLQYEDEAA